MTGRERGRSIALKLAFGIVLAACALAPLVVPASFASFAQSPSAAEAADASSEWPARWNGRPLRPLALSAVEQRFADRFPGRIARLTDGRQVLVWRAVQRPTRMLHPASDCYRGLGWRIMESRLERDGDGLLWRCFVAEREGRRLRVCERIVDARGEAFTDASSWFWAAQSGRSAGPWLAITTASVL